MTLWVSLFNPSTSPTDPAARCFTFAMPVWQDVLHQIGRVVVSLLCLTGSVLAQSADQPGQVADLIPLAPGDHARSLEIGELKRNYLVHVPPAYDPMKPTPLVLALHGAAMNGSMMVWFTGLNKTSDEKGFIVVYPSGTGRDPLLTWNAGGLIGRLKDQRVDDVDFIEKLLDDLNLVLNIDRRRIYACGMSNGGMMCYRLAAEIPDRIAAIAAVSGTMAVDVHEPKRPIPILHLHGTKDEIVPYGAPFNTTPEFFKLRGVEDTIDLWVKSNGCDSNCLEDSLSKEGDRWKVTRRVHPNSKDGAEVVLIIIEGGGHTWPGRQLPIAFLGRSARNISANELIWEFFERHPLEPELGPK